MTPRPQILAVLLTLALAAGAPARPPPLLINESASLPRGLYLRTPARPATGSVVALPQPPAARAYLAGLGAPAEMRLLKRVAAVGGEVVCAQAGTLRWRHGRVRVAERDRRGSRLPAWSGCRALTANEVLVVGEGPLSFDSRYFGPVPRAALEGVYVEVLRW